MPRTKKKGRRGGKARDNAWIDRKDTLETTNERFERYYKNLKIVPDEKWDDFMHSLRQPLPSTFRIAGNRQLAQVLNDAVKNTYIPQLQSGTFEGEPLPVPTPLPWYPDSLAWQINVPRKSLRKSPEYKKFHNFLVFETEVGNISRQEAVSMLPPLFLDVEPHHWVIDMCAAPGSKTTQIIEAFHANDSLSTAMAPTGLLIANDSDNRRTHLLIHQSARLPSPVLMVTNLDASSFPAIKIPVVDASDDIKGGEHGKKRNWRKDKEQQIRFDRILCDVPCSGDGTLRKNLEIWKKWQPLDGNGLHSLQLRILLRGFQMLKNDGRIVYSTCSLNPVENEAVIAAALNHNQEFELVDVSDRLPSLIRIPGLTSWCPAVDRDVDMSFDTYAKYMESLTDERARSSNKMLESHWPPANVNDLKLERCMRIYPHFQDSGGFFVAVLRKKVTAGEPIEPVAIDGKRQAEGVSGPPAPKKTKLDEEISTDSMNVDQSAAKSEPVAMAEEQGKISGSHEHNQTQGKQKQPLTETGGTFKENPFTFISRHEASLQACIKRLNLKPNFPAENLFMRSPEGEPIRSLYLVNDVVKAIMQSTDYTRIRLVSAGVKIFGKVENSKDTRNLPERQIRVLSEGMAAVLPYVNHDTLIAADIGVLRTLLGTYHPLCTSFEEPFRTTMTNKSIGSHISRFKAGTQGPTTLTHDLILPLWRSENAVSLMVEKKAKSALSLRLFGEDITVAGRNKQIETVKVVNGDEEPSTIPGNDSDEEDVDADKNMDE
ncbi:cytosine-5--methyltransferase [Rickenella mellea]|uniref:Cytosine-5--methyltransferase n=1 Tax=Rickenella mellea TaxID=50990 RepID=A0A4Y7QAG3_9AGAM|nr:cytosine-5--methyltransferase [Rickenella mellea]